MVIVSKSRRLVVHLAPVMLLFAVALTAVVVYYGRSHFLWQIVIDCLVSSVVLAVGLGLQRVVRRKGDELEVWTVLGRRRVKAKRVFLGVTTARMSVDIALFLGKSMEPVDPSIMVASYGAYGLAGPLRVAGRIAEALDMPEPRLAPWLRAPPSG